MVFSHNFLISLYILHTTDFTTFYRTQIWAATTFTRPCCWANCRKIQKSEGDPKSRDPTPGISIKRSPADESDNQQKNVLESLQDQETVSPLWSFDSKKIKKFKFILLCDLFYSQRQKTVLLLRVPKNGPVDNYVLPIRGYPILTTQHSWFQATYIGSLSS